MGTFLHAANAITSIKQLILQTVNFYTTSVNEASSLIALASYIRKSNFAQLTSSAALRFPKRRYNEATLK